ncbi:ferritin-like domain-containing protein [Amycolatopsis anabasis]|uniref:ferritin-like domain-containing protein n=1 Tax=Amycolatopsis anabasis TaxID=1840409 RepID=UPI00131C1773|nr:ferritin-like domain-containing protein [Amycolatopsis anabasis]
MTARSTDRPAPRTRREVLRAGALAALAVPLAAACSSGYADGPDPLAPLAEQAKADAAAANAVAGSGLAQQVAAARSAHAQALQSEVDRQNQPKGPAPATPQAPPGMDGLKQRLAQARKQAEELVAGLPRYRAGLVAAVAAGCAALQRLSDQLGPGEAPAPVDPAAAGKPGAESVPALQQALDAEHAAVWVYGLVSAYLPGDFASSANEGAAEHRNRRDACERMLNAAGVAPQAAEPAYVPPKPVTDAASAKSVVATAEADCAASWRGVLENTDDAQLRGVALRALVASARRGTRWRIAAGEQPSAIALPGSPA